MQQSWFNLSEQELQELCNIYFSDQVFPIPGDIMTPSDYPQDTVSPVDTTQFELDAGVPPMSSTQGEATSHMPDISSDWLSWWTAANNDLSLMFTPENNEPSPTRSSNFTSISHYQRESSSFDAQPVQNNLFPSPWSEFDALNCDDIPTHIDPSPIMALETTFFASPIKSVCDKKDNPANELDPLKAFKRSSSPSQNPQNNAGIVGDLGADNFEFLNYVLNPPPQTDPVINQPFLDGNAPYQTPPIAGPSTGGNTMYAPNQLGASSSREQKRPRADTCSNEEPAEEEPPRLTTKRQRKAESSVPHARGQAGSVDHKEGRRYPCPNPQCFRTFTRANDAKRHAKSSHNEASFACDISDACEPFQRRDSLHRHKRIVHDIHHGGCRCRKCRNVPPRE